MKDFEKKAIRFITDKVIEMNNPNINIDYSVHFVGNFIEFDVSVVDDSGDILAITSWDIDTSDPITYLRDVEKMIKNYSYGSLER